MSLFIFVDSLFPIQSWVSGVTVRRQGSEKRKEGKEETRLYMVDKIR